MNTISREELKMRMAQNRPVQLLMALDRNNFERQHIPGSVHFNHLEEAVKSLSPEQEVVVYCTNPTCPASYRAYYMLRSQGFKNLYRYTGGLEEWVAAGDPVEGKEV